jgi:hypothetical protein
MAHHFEVSEVLLDLVAVLEIARRDIEQEVGSLHFRTNAVRGAELRDEQNF